MKLKRILPLVLAAAAGYGSFSLINAENADIAIDDANFPDAAFRGYISEEFDSDNNGVLSPEEIENANDILIDDMGISSLKGIELLTQLESLSCDNNGITSIDLSRSKELEFLSCCGNNLTSLDISANTELDFLDCCKNNLTALDLSGNPSLKLVYCGENRLTTLNVGNLSELTALYCTNNNISALDVSHNPELTELDCGSNGLTALDVSNNPMLETLECAKNGLVSLDVSGNSRLMALNCPDNKLGSLVIGSKSKLKILNCRQNPLRTLDLSKCNEIQLLLFDDDVDVTPSDGHVHDPEAEWSFDETSHWHKCHECGGKTDVSAHTSDSSNISKTTAGNGEEIITYTCNVCGNVYKTERVKISYTVSLSVSGRGRAQLSAERAYAGDTVTVTAQADSGYVLESIEYNGIAVTDGKFVMPAGNVTVNVRFAEDLSAYIDAARPYSYIFCYDKDMSLIKTFSNHSFEDSADSVYVTVRLGEEYAGRKAVLYSGRKSQKAKVGNAVLDSRGCYTFEVGKAKNYSLIIEDQ